MNLKLDETLHRLFMLTFRYEEPDKTKVRSCLSDLSWYINTGRAATPFIRTLISLKGCQRKALLNRMLNAEDGATDSRIKAAAAYIEEVQMRTKNA